MQDIHVKISQAKIGKEGDRLRAVLGSCVGLAFIWKQKNIYGLAHCLLPEYTGKELIKSNENPAKFISEAIPALISLMKIGPDKIKEIEVHIAGGGNLITQLKNMDDIGKLNIEAAKKYLKKYGFRIKGEDVGGTEGRQIYINCSTATVTVEKIKK